MRGILGLFFAGWVNLLLGITHLSTYVNEGGFSATLGLLFGSFHIMLVLVIAVLIVEALNE